MTKPAHIEAAIDQGSTLESLLRVLSLAIEGEQIAGTTLAVSGGRAVIDMAADIASELVEGLERGGGISEPHKSA